jgi:Protein of unknown function (DUF2818)
MSEATLIIIFFIIANLPWVSDRILCVFPLQSPKKVIVRLLEMVVFYIVSLLIAIAFEMKFSGEVYPQGWEFFTITLCLFLVLAVPGVVYRYQWLTISKEKSS